MATPGPLNALCDVPGLRVGHAHDAAMMTGVTLIIPDAPMTAAVDVRGGAPGTRETDLLRPDCLVDRIDALVLSGGSAYGLDAAGAVTERLRAAGRGFAVPGPIPHVPIVPAAILFDLANGGKKDWALCPPYRRLADEAWDKLGLDAALGNVGAGMGALAGRFKGGLGQASACDESYIVGALVAANPVGSPLWPDGRLRAADCFLPADGWADAARPVAAARDSFAFTRLAHAFPAGQTTLAVVAVNQALTKADAHRLAIQAQDGLARALDPVHTPFDGDAVFVLAPQGDRPVDPLTLARLGWLAAHTLTRAVGRGLMAAQSFGPWRSVADWRNAPD